jgi:hypothetical protein
LNNSGSAGRLGGEHVEVVVAVEIGETDVETSPEDARHTAKHSRR